MLTCVDPPSAPGQPAADDEEEHEEEERQPTAPLKRTVDEAEDKKEEYDEEDGEEKATVGVVKALPEPEAGAPQAEPTGQRSDYLQLLQPLPLLFNSNPALWFQGVPACTRHRPRSPAPRLQTEKVGTAPPTSSNECFKPEKPPAVCDGVIYLCRANYALTLFSYSVSCLLKKPSDTPKRVSAVRRRKGT